MWKSKKFCNELVVVYFTSNLFAEPCGVSIASLFHNNTRFNKITVYIIEDQISEENKTRFYALAEKYSRTIQLIPTPNPITFFGDNRFTFHSLGHTFGRMIVGQLIPESVNKVICLDSDMLILESLESLWNEDMGDNYLAGVDSAPGVAMMKKSLKIEPGTLYCNGGFFIVNLEQVRKDHIEEKYKTYIQSIFDQKVSLAAYEEEVMNKCAYPKVIRLPPQYNLMTVNIVMDYDSFVKFRCAVNYYTREEMKEACAHPVIIHAINTFYVQKRIWEKNSDSPYATEYRKFRILTPWKSEPEIEIKRTKKQVFMKKIWHFMPRKMAFALAAWVRNEVRPKLNKKRDDE